MSDLRRGWWGLVPIDTVRQYSEATWKKMVYSGLRMVMSGSEFFFFSSRRRHTRLQGDWSSDVCSSDLLDLKLMPAWVKEPSVREDYAQYKGDEGADRPERAPRRPRDRERPARGPRPASDRKSVV